MPGAFPACRLYSDDENSDRSSSDGCPGIAGVSPAERKLQMSVRPMTAILVLNALGLLWTMQANPGKVLPANRIGKIQLDLGGIRLLAS